MLRSRSRRLDAWRSGAFNGQERRAEIFDELLHSISFRAIVETGTYRGITTERLRASGLPVWTIESAPRFFHFARRKFRGDPRVTPQLGDSRTVLERLASDGTLPRDHVFFYLDAHWGSDLPLADELRLVARRFDDCVVMIDDFEVPGDPAFTFDDYGPGKRLCRAYLPSDVLPSFRVFWPRASGSTETGERRGCAILCSPSLEATLLAMRTVRPESG
jgi:hypothetical protein